MNNDLVLLIKHKGNCNKVLVNCNNCPIATACSALLTMVGSVSQEKKLYNKFYKVALEKFIEAGGTETDLVELLL